MKRLYTLLYAFFILSAAVGQVKPGIEVLRDDGFAALRGKRVGLITNPTGVDNSLRSTIDILNSARGVKLTALFAPEHGVRGDHPAGAAVATTADPATGITVYSLHGSRTRPSAEMLRNVDVLVYDIQDIGARSYTFISTMGAAMEACADAGKEFMVLDRPNPLGGIKVEGPVIDEGCSSFVGRYPIPYLYGLTPGELAIYLNDEGLLIGGKKVKLTVIPMEGWERRMKFADTGMPWVLPSPHIPSPETAILSPATGILGELSRVNIGVGYTMPFRLITAPWIDADRLAARMDSLRLPGIMFRPVHIKPYYSTFKGEETHGVEVYVTDPDAAELTLVQFYAMQELAAMYPDRKIFSGAAPARLDMFDKVCGTPRVRRTFCKNYKVADLLPLWHKDLEWFREKKTAYHLYD